MTPKETIDPAWRQTDPPDLDDDTDLEAQYEDRQNGGAEFDGYFDQWDEPDMDVYGGNYSEM